MDHWETTNKNLDLNLLLMLGYSRKNYKSVAKTLDIDTSELEIATQTNEQSSENCQDYSSETAPMDSAASPFDDLLDSDEVCSEYSGGCPSDYEDDISSSEPESSRSEDSSGFQSLSDKDTDNEKDTQGDDDFTDDIITDSDDECGRSLMPDWVESWIKSPVAVNRMVSIMKAERNSERHQLYLQRRQRERCNGAETSTLYSLSNPSYLGVGGEEDSEVISYLIKTIFDAYFKQAEQRIQDIGRDGAFVYSSCVLFPETFIHYLEERNQSSYSEAEDAFLYSPVDEEERASLEKEIEEGANDMADEESEDDWVDASDVESDDLLND